MKIKKLTQADVIITIEAEPEGAAIDESIIEDEKIVAKIKRDYESGNVWAWCSICVTCEYMGLQAEDYLGQCSYASKEDFIKTSGYYEDMVKTCIEDLQKQLNAIVSASVEE